MSLKKNIGDYSPLLAEELSYDDIPHEPKPLWMLLEPPPNIYRDYLVKRIQELDIDYFKIKEEKRRKISKVTQEIN